MHAGIFNFYRLTAFQVAAFCITAFPGARMVQYGGCGENFAEREVADPAGHFMIWDCRLPASDPDSAWLTDSLP